MVINKPTSTGVKNIPIIFDADALHIAAATFPRAIDVKAIDDCTVDGSTQIYKTPKYNVGVSSGSKIG